MYKLIVEKIEYTHSKKIYHIIQESYVLNKLTDANTLEGLYNYRNIFCYYIYFLVNTILNIIKHFNLNKLTVSCSNLNIFRKID
jgi:hypothetical protein